MEIKWKQIVTDTSKSVNRDEKFVAIVIKHFFRGLKLLMKEYALFTDNGMFKTYIKKLKRNRNNVK